MECEIKQYETTTTQLEEQIKRQKQAFEEQLKEQMSKLSQEQFYALKKS